MEWSLPRTHEDLKSERRRGPSGLYLIIAGKRIAGKWNEGTFKLVDIGQSRDVYLRIAEHEREGCWHPKARGSSLLVKVAELSEAEYDEEARRALVCCLRATESPPCGNECNDGYHRDVVVTISNRGELTPLQASYSCYHQTA